MNLKIRFRRFIAKYLSSLVELVYLIKFKTIRFNKPPIIILTPGKVGSTSVYYTLKNEAPNQVFHIHNFSKEGIEKSIRDHIHSNRKSKPLHLIISKILRKKFKTYTGKLFIISIIREPISRAISSFFQNTDQYKDILENKKLEIDINIAQKILQEKFETDICKELKDWFDLEIKGNFGIDVFAQKFDYDNKYVISQNNHNHLLLLKMEDLDSVFPVAIKDLLSLDAPMQLQKSNVSDNKFYASTYNNIKNNIKLDQKAISQIVNSDFFQNFYLQDKSKVIDKWSKN
ncbi:putative capsular polysaccharide synthesis family protein [Psychroserpens jangbogonensis]|uniref:putative capsular polysaccharide synthesis family protein n=1 Tax=Psychroserpens jangbogonensis TaxID=1484460 RepID=UPI00053E15BF|nr:putative capsular polysaccharide synthesis family protein [Psychroserpens jangbogonensis]